jgi:hypothetical protein
LTDRRRRFYDRRVRWLGLIAVAALAALGLLILSVGEPEREELWTDVGKGLIDVVVVVVLGGLVKQLADAHQDRRRRTEAQQRFREDKYDRIVAATSALRRGLITMTTGLEQTSGAGLRALLDADATLRAVKHEIYASKALADRPLRDPDPVIRELESMFGYTTTTALAVVSHVVPPPAGDGGVSVNELLDRPKLHEKTTPVRTWADYQRTEGRVLRRLLADSANSPPSMEGLDAPRA